MIIETVLAAFIAITPTNTQTVQQQNIQAVRAAAQLPSEWHDFQVCVASRESSNRYTAQNPTSSAQGKYQFLDSQWRHGGGWNVIKRLRAHGYNATDARRVLKALHATPIKRWRPVYQEILFAQVLTSGEGRGWKHWFLAGSKCNRLAAT